MDADQQAMIWQLRTSGNGVDVVVGKAGTGKSTALAVARQALEAAGIPIIGVAPPANAARQLEQAAGIGSCTLDKLLVKVEHEVRHLPSGACVVLDLCRLRDYADKALAWWGNSLVGVGFEWP